MYIQLKRIQIWLSPEGKEEDTVGMRLYFNNEFDFKCFSGLLADSVLWKDYLSDTPAQVFEFGDDALAIDVYMKQYYLESLFADWNLRRSGYSSNADQLLKQALNYYNVKRGVGDSLYHEINKELHTFKEKLKRAMTVLEKSSEKHRLPEEQQEIVDVAYRRIKESYKKMCRTTPNEQATHDMDTAKRYISVKASEIYHDPVISKHSLTMSGILKDIMKSFMWRPLHKIYSSVLKRSNPNYHKENFMLFAHKFTERSRAQKLLDRSTKVINKA